MGLSPTPADPASRASRWLGALALLLGIAFLYGPTRGHVDDTDAQLYQVIARHMVQDHTWFDLRYLPHLMPRFREHLPFGFWPFALAIRSFGEGALPWVGFAFCAGVLVLTWRTGAALLGEAAGAIALLVLGTTDSFVFFGARPRLDPPLMLLATAAGVVVLLRPLRAADWLVAGLLATLAALVKGPFGAIPLAAAVVARAVVDRSWRILVIGTAVGVASMLPVALFLLHDHLAGSGTWWTGYVQHQIVASELGTRTDGASSFWFPFVDLAARFWPGLPLLVAAAVVELVALRRPAPTSPLERNRRLVVLAAVLALLALTLPHRKMPNHALVAYPLLALASGAAAGPWLEHLLRTARRRRFALGASAVLCVALAATEVAWLGRRLTHACPFSGPLRAALAAPPEAPVLLLTRPLSWHTVSELAAEFRLNAIPVDSLPAAGSSPDGAMILVAQENLLPATLGVWREAARAQGWVVLRQDAP